jgi:hypothetical protein
MNKLLGLIVFLFVLLALMVCLDLSGEPSPTPTPDVRKAHNSTRDPVDRAHPNCNPKEHGGKGCHK